MDEGRDIQVDPFVPTAEGQAPKITDGGLDLGEAGVGLLPGRRVARRAVDHLVMAVFLQVVAAPDDLEGHQRLHRRRHGDAAAALFHLQARLGPGHDLAVGGGLVAVEDLRGHGAAQDLAVAILQVQHRALVTGLLEVRVARQGRRAIAVGGAIGPGRQVSVIGRLRQVEMVDGQLHALARVVEIMAELGQQVDLVGFGGAALAADLGRRDAVAFGIEVAVARGERPGDQIVDVIAGAADADLRRRGQGVRGMRG